MALAALIVAIVAGVISVMSFGWTIGWSIWQHRRTTRPRLHVHAGFASVPAVAEASALAITAVNVGQVPVTLTGVWADAGADNQLALVRFKLQSPGPLSLTLGPGENWVGILDGEDIRKGIAELTPSDPPWDVFFSVQDAARTRHGRALVRFNRGPLVAEDIWLVQDDR